MRLVCRPGANAVALIEPREEALREWIVRAGRAVFGGNTAITKWIEEANAAIEAAHKASPGPQQQQQSPVSPLPADLLKAVCQHPAVVRFVHQHLVGRCKDAGLPSHLVGASCSSPARARLHAC